MTTQMPPVKFDTFRFDGGLDLVTPTLALTPGVARAALNFEISVTGGYTRIPGYERFSGQPAPSSAQIGVITLSLTTGLVVGNTIVNAAATASGVVVAIDANSNVIFTKGVGAFTAGDVIKVGGVTIGTSVATTNYAPDAKTQAQYMQSAANNYRADIGVVPGAGPIRGIVHYGGVTYAWRNNAGNSAMAIYKSSTSGWVPVPLGFELAFNTGAGTTFNEGDTVFGGTSSATGVVSRVVLASGTTWVGGSGRLVLSSTTGVFVSGEALKLTNGVGVIKATGGGAAAAITLAPNGRVQTIKNSFGSNVGQRVYGADGVNRGFEFDGVVYVPVTTGMLVDTPSCVAVHNHFLFFSFGPSVQNSGIGTPYVWSPVFGANEFVLPEAVTALLTLPGSIGNGALSIFSTQNHFILYGTSVQNFSLVSYNAGIGALAYTPQQMENTYTCSERGLNTTTAMQRYSNFETKTYTENVQPFLIARRALATASALNRDKSQYRVFYSDGYALYTTMVDNQPHGVMPMLFPDPVNVWCENDLSSTSETSFYGGSLGYVYTLDVGTSFDGAAINAYVTLNYTSESSVRVLKRYRRASVEASGLGYADFAFGYSLAYGSLDIDQAGVTQYTSPFSSAFWDAFTWDSFTWDGRTLAPSEVECIGTGENIAVTISTNSDINQPFTINSATLHYTPRRGIR